MMALHGNKTIIIIALPCYATTVELHDDEEAQVLVSAATADSTLLPTRKARVCLLVQGGTMLSNWMRLLPTVQVRALILVPQ